MEKSRKAMTCNPAKQKKGWGGGGGGGKIEYVLLVNENLNTQKILKRNSPAGT
jgi:hypothetical protein